jgi:putative cardiolipin synthase
VGRVIRAAIALLQAWALAGCAALPPRGPAAESAALPAADAATTRLARIAAASGPADPVATSGFRLLPTGEYAFDARAALTEWADRTIDAQYYHLHDDSAGVEFLRELRDAALRGVRVRLLVDDYHARDVFNLLVALDALPQAEVRLFNPLPARRGTPLLRMLLSAREFDRAHRRMHNKLFVADNQVAVYGGRNVADEYFMRSGEANFIDLDVLSVGAVVPELSRAFDAYWNSEHAWPLTDVPGAGRNAAYELRLFDERAAQVPLRLQVAPADPLGQTSVRVQLAAGRLLVHRGRAEVHADPPSKVSEPAVLYQPTPAMRAKLDVIAAARDEVVIVNPYFLPSEPGMRMMAEAARQRVRGTIFTNSLGSTDEPLVHRAYGRYRADMLRLGMVLYELNPQQLQRLGDFGDFGRSTARLHVKAAAVDRRWLLVGSVNLDARSALHNTELSVTIDCPPLVADALRALGDEPFRTMYRVQLAGDGQALQWREIDEQGRVRLLDEEPGDSAALRLQHGLQSLFVGEDLL